MYPLFSGSTGYEHPRHNKGPKKRFRNGGMMPNGGLDPQQGGGFNKQLGGGGSNGGIMSKVNSSVKRIVSNANFWQGFFIFQCAPSREIFVKTNFFGD